MDRRAFLTAARKKVSAKKEPVRSYDERVDSDLTPYAGTWTRQEVAHLLKRTMFGATKAD
ncbi:MAG: hypothetical protein JNN29_07145, partial [Chitinophagaceae bacterium]|nr:hypothetical protein [Chitinophagaceae bacterium]